MEESTVYILLAAYNGSAYIREQIDSLLKQDYAPIRIILSDDGSSDGTEQILDEYGQQYPDKVVHYRSGIRFGCAQKHFMHLLQVNQDAPYIMFCDQDDVWHRDKVSRTLRAMQQLENGESIPALVHTDLRVVDGELREISPSFWRYSKLDGSRLALNQLLVQNVVTGCTMMINRSLAQIACRCVPDEMLMHDWWLALLASVCGKTGCLSEATIDYRQHGKNAVGAKNVRSFNYLWKRLKTQGMQHTLADNALQAQMLLQCHHEIINSKQISAIRAFIRAQKSPWVIRNYLYIRYGFLKKGFIRKAVQLLGI